MQTYGDPAVGVRDEMALIEHEGRPDAAIEADVRAAKAQMAMMESNEMDYPQPMMRPVGPYGAPNY